MLGGPVTGRCCAMGGCFGAGCCRSGGGVGCSVGDGRAVGVDRWIVGEMDGPLLGPFFKSKKNKISNPKASSSNLDMRNIFVYLLLLSLLQFSFKF